VIRCTNQIDECCSSIEKTIEHTVQNTLNQLEADCHGIVNLIDTAVQLDDTARKHNFKSRVWGLLLFIVLNLVSAIFPPLRMILCTILFDT